MSKDKEFLNVEEVIYSIQEYFSYCDREEKPYTMSGLALELNISRQTLVNYANASYKYKGLSDEDNILLVDTIVKARQMVERYNEEQLYRKTQVAGVIFNLKNNFGWKDSQEITTNSTSNTNVSGLTKEELKELLYAEQDQA